MHVIAMIVQKGGTGKSTIGLSLAVAAHQQGQNVLVIDIDPQGTACNWKDRRAEEQPLVVDSQPARLQAVLEKAEQGGVDLVIIDTPAKSDQSAVFAAKAADLVLVPCRPSAFDLETINSTKEILRLAGDKPALAILNAVPSTGDRDNQAFELLNSLGVPNCPHTIGNRVAFYDAGMAGKSVTEIDPKGKAAEEILNVYKYISRLLANGTERQVAYA